MGMFKKIDNFLFKPDFIETVDVSDSPGANHVHLYQPVADEIYTCEVEAI